MILFLLTADKCATFGKRFFLGEDQWREVGQRWYIQRSYGKLLNKSYRSVSCLCIKFSQYSNVFDRSGDVQWELLFQQWLVELKKKRNLFTIVW